MRKYLVRIDGRTIFATTNAKRAEKRAKATPGAKLLKIPAVR